MLSIYNIINNSAQYRNRLVYCLIVLMLPSCDFDMKYKNKPVDEFDLITNEWNENQAPHLKPMFGNEKQSLKQQEADKVFIASALKFFKGDTAKATKRYAKKGWYYFSRNIIDTAMFRFNQSWLLDSTYAESYFGFAAIKEYQGLTDEAEKLYKIGCMHDKADSVSPHILNKISSIKEWQKDTNSVIKAYHRAYSMFPKNELAASKLGYFYATLNKNDSALKYYNISIALDPKDEQTYFNRGWLFCQTGRFKDAISDYSFIISKRQNSIRGYASRANAYMLNSQYDLAIIDLNHSIALDPKHPNFNIATAECFHKLKQDKKACDEIHKGINKGGQYTNKLKEYNCQ
jgi:tetratricopeptide (TPR) repeat protein